MADDTSVAQIFKYLKLTHLVALITILIGLIIGIGYQTIYLIAGRTLTDYTIITLGVMAGLSLIVFFWTSGIISGSYISGAAKMGEVAMSGGQTPVPIAGITSGGVVFQGLTANDLTALQSLISAGKISSSLIPLLQTMTPDQIKALIQTFSK